MQLRTILNRVYKLPGFVYGKIRLVEREDGSAEVEVEIVPRSNGRARCSGCGEPAPCYDRRERRRYQFVPVLGLPTYFLYEMRRVDCRRCGKVQVERVPWAEGKQRSTKALRWFLASWAKRLSWQETAQVFGVSWERVWRAVGMAVEWGRERVQLDGVSTIGVDEIAWQKGHKYLTLVYQLEAGSRRLLWVGRERKIETLEGFFDWFGEQRSGRLEVVCSDMWKAYLRVVAERGERGGARAGPFPHRAETGQGDRRGAGGGSEAVAGARGAAGAEERALVAAATQGEPERGAGVEACGAGEAELADGAGVPAEGGFPAVLGQSLADGGTEVPGALVPEGHALATGADEEGCEDAEAASAAGAELVPDREELFLGCGGGDEPQSQTGYEKSVRVPILQVLRTRFIPFTWEVARAQSRPPILLKSRLFYGYTGGLAGKSTQGTGTPHGLAHHSQLMVRPQEGREAAGRYRRDKMCSRRAASVTPTGFHAGLDCVEINHHRSLGGESSTAVDTELRKPRLRWQRKGC